MIREIHFDSSLNLENNDTPKNFFKDKPVIKKFLKKDDTDFGLIESFLEKKESSDQFESKIPYSNIPCLKCKGIGRKNDKEVCPKCDGSGKMKNSKKLKKIEYLIEKKLQALLTEIANRKKQSEIQKPTLSKPLPIINFHFL